MKPLKIALFGGSNCIIHIPHGLAKGLENTYPSTAQNPAPKYHNNQVFNFSVGNSGSAQNLYELIRQASSPRPQGAAGRAQRGELFFGDEFAQAATSINHFATDHPAADHPATCSHSVQPDVAAFADHSIPGSASAAVSPGSCGRGVAFASHAPGTQATPEAGSRCPQFPQPSPTLRGGEFTPSHSAADGSAPGPAAFASQPGRGPGAITVGPAAAVSAKSAPHFLDTCDLIVAESFLNDALWLASTRGATLEAAQRHIALAYQALAALGKRTLILLLPFVYHSDILAPAAVAELTAGLRRLHLAYARRFGLCLIDAYEYYRRAGLFSAFNDDAVHEPQFILQSLGRLIARNFDSFTPPKCPAVSAPICRIIPAPLCLVTGGGGGVKPASPAATPSATDTSPAATSQREPGPASPASNSPVAATAQSSATPTSPSAPLAAQSTASSSNSTPASATTPTAELATPQLLGLCHFNSIFAEEVRRLDEGSVLRVPEDFEGWFILGFCAWNCSTGTSAVNVAFENEPAGAAEGGAGLTGVAGLKLIKPNIADFVRFVQLNQPFPIHHTRIYTTTQPFTEVPDGILFSTLNQYKNKLTHLDLIALLVCESADFEPISLPEEEEAYEGDFSFLLDELYLGELKAYRKTYEAKIEKLMNEKLMNEKLTLSLAAAYSRIRTMESHLEERLRKLTKRYYKRLKSFFARG